MLNLLGYMLAFLIHSFSSTPCVSENQWMALGRSWAKAHGLPPGVDDVAYHDGTHAVMELHTRLHFSYSLVTGPWSGWGAEFLTFVWADAHTGEFTDVLNSLKLRISELLGDEEAKELEGIHPLTLLYTYHMGRLWARSHADNVDFLNS